MQNNQQKHNETKKLRPGQLSRPKNLNLFTIRLPINALVSILHRATGCLLFLILPLILLLVQLSLSSAEQYQMVVNILHFPLVKLLLLGVAWAFFHHFFAGIRHLAMDIHWMTSLMKARYTSKLVLVFGAIATIALAIQLWI